MRKSLFVTFCLLAGLSATAHAQTLLRTCQRIELPGTYTLQATQDAAATGPCFDVTATDVHIAGPSLITCSPMGWGISFESPYNAGGNVGGGTGNVKFNGCQTQIIIAHQDKDPGVSVNFTAAHPMIVNGGSNCQYSIWAADSQRVHLNFGTGGLMGTCAGEISPHVGGKMPTVVSGTIGEQQ